MLTMSMQEPINYSLICRRSICYSLAVNGSVPYQYSPTPVSSPERFAEALDRYLELRIPGGLHLLVKCGGSRILHERDPVRG